MSGRPVSKILNEGNSMDGKLCSWNPDMRCAGNMLQLTFIHLALSLSLRSLEARQGIFAASVAAFASLPCTGSAAPGSGAALALSFDRHAISGDPT
jgi:hypothetical protein